MVGIIWCILWWKLSFKTCLSVKDKAEAIPNSDWIWIIHWNSFCLRWERKPETAEVRMSSFRKQTVVRNTEPLKSITCWLLQHQILIKKRRKNEQPKKEDNQIGPLQIDSTLCDSPFSPAIREKELRTDSHYFTNNP